METGGNVELQKVHFDQTAWTNLNTQAKISCTPT